MPTPPIDVPNEIAPALSEALDAPSPEMSAKQHYHLDL